MLLSFPSLRAASCRLRCALLPLAAAGLCSCQPTLVAEFQDRPVVECYLFSNEVAQLRVARLIPYRDGVSFSDEALDQLAISLTDETSGEATTLASQGGGLYAGDSSFLPQAGHTYRLQFAYDGEEVSATTTIAEMPEGVTFSVTDITAPSFGGGMGGPVAATPLTITWSNPAQDYYLLAVRCIDPDSVRLDSGVVRTMSDVLTQDSAALLSPMQLSYTGRHAVKLCRLQPEYVLLLQRHEQGKTSETVQEVNANVEGGFGIFTGVSAYSGVVVVHK